MTSCILWNNSPDDISEGDGVPIVSFSDVQEGYPGIGNIQVDPKFVDAVHDDFHLTAFSPCVDAGDNAIVVGTDDFEGDPRIAWDGIVDIGADEFYNHLYYTGDSTPGSVVRGKLVGKPAASPVGLFISPGLLEEPVHSGFGDFWLKKPWRLVTLAPIPANGVLILPFEIPLAPPAPWDLAMQGLVGLEPDSLTNPCVLEVR